MTLKKRAEKQLFVWPFWPSTFKLGQRDLEWFKSSRQMETHTPKTKPHTNRNLNGLSARGCSLMIGDGQIFSFQSFCTLAW